jgi:hypothetical protein
VGHAHAFVHPIIRGFSSEMIVRRVEFATGKGRPADAVLAGPQPFQPPAPGSPGTLLNVDVVKLARGRAPVVMGKVSLKGEGLVLQIHAPPGRGIFVQLVQDIRWSASSRVVLDRSTAWPVGHHHLAGQIKGHLVGLQIGSRWKWPPRSPGPPPRFRTIKTPNNHTSTTPWTTGPRAVPRNPPRGPGRKTRQAVPR